MKKLILLLAILIVSYALQSQNISNPYASIGKKKPKVATLTNGAYNEFYIKDTLVLINDNAISRKTGDIVFSKKDNPQIIAELIKKEEDKFRFLSTDPMSNKYPSISPYVFCLNNPIYFVDPTGGVVEPHGGAATLFYIKQTLTSDDRAFVKIDPKTGFIDANLMNSHTSTSKNYNSLLYLVNHKEIAKVSIAKSFRAINKGSKTSSKHDFHETAVVPEAERKNILSDKDYIPSTFEGGGLLGITIAKKGANPNNPAPDSPTTNSNKFEVVINESLSDQGKTEVAGHEMYGHLHQMFKKIDEIKTNGSSDINPHHDYDHPTNGTAKQDMNCNLKDRINESAAETKINSKQP